MFLIDLKYNIFTYICTLDRRNMWKEKTQYDKFQCTEASALQWCAEYMK